jgi:hypothetical protein
MSEHLSREELKDELEKARAEAEKQRLRAEGAEAASAELAAAYGSEKNKCSENKQTIKMQMLEIEQLKHALAKKTKHLNRAEYKLEKLQRKSSETGCDEASTTTLSAPAAAAATAAAPAAASVAPATPLKHPDQLDISPIRRRKTRASAQPLPSTPTRGRDGAEAEAESPAKRRKE